MRDDRAIAPLIADRFVTVVAPIDRDWSSRGEAHVLRCAQFVADGVTIERPLTIYTRFAPPAIEMQRFVRAEGFLRRNEKGDAVLTVKSPRLMSYEGSLNPLDARGVEPRAAPIASARSRARIRPRSRSSRRSPSGAASG